MVEGEGPQGRQSGVMETDPIDRCGSPMTEGLDPLVGCPFCGANSGYTLGDGSTFRWWTVLCAGCGAGVAECRSDNRTKLDAPKPDKWAAADAAWNEAGAHAHKLRVSLAAIHHRVCHGESTFGICETIASECEAALPALRALRG